MGLFDAIGSFLGQKSANKTNIRLAQENRDWQQMMSNTAYQRSSKDLDAAGLNRILALGSPATTPAGNVATVQNEVEKGVGARSTAAQIALLKAQTAKTLAEKNVIENKEGMTSPAGKLGNVVSNTIDKIKGGIGVFRATVEPEIVEQVSNTAKTFKYGAKAVAAGKRNTGWAAPGTWQQKLERWYENEKARGKAPSERETREKGLEYLRNEIGLERRR